MRKYTPSFLFKVRYKPLHDCPLGQAMRTSKDSPSCDCYAFTIDGQYGRGRVTAANEYPGIYFMLHAARLSVKTSSLTKKRITRWHPKQPCKTIITQSNTSTHREQYVLAYRHTVAMPTRMERRGALYTTFLRIHGECDA
jgi:hypothetical protein